MENTALNFPILSSVMALFEAGEYDEALTLASGTNDTSLMLLAMEKYDIAEMLLRSLIRICFRLIELISKEIEATIIA